MRLMITDDLDEREKDQFNEATVTTVVSLDGIIRELHLTQAHYDELARLMGRYVQAGHEPGAGPVTDPAPEPPRGGQGSRREIPGTREFLARVRAYAAAHGIEVPTAGGRRATYKYSAELQVSIAQDLRRRAEGGDPQAAADLVMARRISFLPAEPGGAPPDA
jgi:hypothetical protein